MKTSTTKLKSTVLDFKALLMTSLTLYLLRPQPHLQTFSTEPVCVDRRKHNQISFNKQDSSILFLYGLQSMVLNDIWKTVLQAYFCPMGTDQSQKAGGPNLNLLFLLAYQTFFDPFVQYTSPYFEISISSMRPLKRTDRETRF